MRLPGLLTQSFTRPETTNAGTDQRADPTGNAMTIEGMRSFGDRLDPALVVPAVAYLAHEDYPDSGEMYTVGAGHLARFFIARTNGYFNPALSREDVRDHFAENREETGYAAPRDPVEAGGWWDPRGAGAPPARS
ncbi:hypothetical protein AB0E04_10635 [Streptomyces sp. NPDC048251]|uniref:hypothetical protein n=1 Tax=Streptomyces sp. NPDC048251 TaxID=3154501 RepID=UPI00342477AA